MKFLKLNGRINDDRESDRKVFAVLCPAAGRSSAKTLSKSGVNHIKSEIKYFIDRC